MGRRCKKLVPEADTLLKPRYSTEEETHALTGSKQRQQHQYNHHAKPVYSRPLPSEKNRRRGICGGSGRLYILRLASTDNPVLSLVLKRPITKFQCLVAKDYRTTVCRCLVHRPRYSARLVCLRFGSRCRSEFFFSDTPPQCLARDCVGRSRTGTTHGNVYRSVREKTENCCLSSKCFKNSDISACCFTSISSARPLKITNINPQQEARFSPRKEKT